MAHEGIVRTRIHQLKFEGQLEWTPALAELLEGAVADLGCQTPELILPVPLHVRRLRERGFNQSGLLAGVLGRRLGLKVSFDTIVRKNPTLPQSSLNRKDRLRNVKGAFELTGYHAVNGRRVLIVDDVFTTGTTLSECAGLLKKKGGALEVNAVTVTRALVG